MEKSAKEVLAAGLVGEVVDFAIEKNRIATAATKELEAVKPFLREAGLADAGRTGEKTANLVGLLGTAQIVFPVAKPVAKKGVDLSASAETSLPAEVFAALFTKRIVTVVEPVADFEEKLAAMKLTPAQRAALANLVEVQPQTPRVNLPK